MPPAWAFGSFTQSPGWSMKWVLHQPWIDSFGIGPGSRGWVVVGNGMTDNAQMQYSELFCNLHSQCALHAHKEAWPGHGHIDTHFAFCEAKHMMQLPETALTGSHRVTECMTWPQGFSHDQHITATAYFAALWPMLGRQTSEWAWWPVLQWARDVQTCLLEASWCTWKAGWLLWYKACLGRGTVGDLSSLCTLGTIKLGIARMISVKSWHNMQVCAL